MKTRMALLLVFLLVACASVPHKADSTAVLPTTSPTPTVYYLFGFTPTWTATMPTPDLAILATIQSDRDRYATQDAAKLEAAEEICGNDGYFPGLSTEIRSSPDGNWTVITCRIASALVTKVARSDRQIVWQIPWEQVFPWTKDVPDGTLLPVHWSRNGRSVFLESYVCCYDWFSNEGYFYNDTDLYKLDLGNGDFKMLLDDKGSYSIAFSPDDRFLIYSRYRQTGRIDLLELATGLDRILRLSDRYVDVGMFRWTADSRQVVFPAALDGWLDGRAGISLYRLDVSNRSLTPLLVDDRRQFLPEFYLVDTPWLDTRTLLLHSLVDDSRAAIDIQSGTLQALATPMP
jgi:hypothetical protein